MQAIYQALLLISQSPSKATKALNNLAYKHQNFLQLLKDMALQFKDRFRPHNAKTQAEYDIMSKQMLVIFNRYVKLTFQQKGKNIYIYLQDIQKWTLQILATQHIHFNFKKTLQPSLTEIINNICFKKQKFLLFLDTLTASHFHSASSIFIYLQCLLQSQVSASEKIESIEQSYHMLYYIAFLQLNKMIEYYKNSYMEIDCGESTPINHFAQMLKQNQYILKTICKFISYIYNMQTKHKHNNPEFIHSLLLNNDLAVYLSRILKIESEMFDHSNSQNLFDLKIIIANNLKTQQKVIVNKIKTNCLAILKLILEMTDKQFNLIHTDKAILKEVLSLGQLIIQQLIICSHSNVIASLGEELSIIGILATLFDILAEIALFVDMKQVFQKLNVQQIIRLTLAFMKTYNDQLEVFQNQIEQYFVLVYYILYGRIDEAQEDTIDLALGQFCLKKNAVQLIKSMAHTLQGFHSILMEVCCDVILLEMKLRQTKNQQLKEMFLSKYNLQANIFDCLSLQSALLVFTVLLSKSSNKLEENRKLRFLLQTIDIDRLKQIQLCRLYACLSAHSYLFEDNSIHTKYYKYIEHAFKLNKIQNSVSKQAFYFLQRLTKFTNYYEHDDHKKYWIFLDKVFNDTINWLEGASCFFIFEFLINSLSSHQILNNGLNLGWTNSCLDKLSDCISRQITQKTLKHQLITSILILYTKLIKFGKNLIQNNNKTPYSTFNDEIDQFNNQFSIPLTQQLFDVFSKIVKDKDLIIEQYFLVYRFGDFLFDILINDIPLTQQSVQLITNYTIQLLIRPELDNTDFNNMSFKLLYQVINKNPFNLQEWHYQLILNWMKQDIEKGEIDELFLNRICIILQEFYFFIEGNIFLKNQMINFFSTITLAVEKKFLKYLDEQEYHHLVQVQTDPDIKKINILNMKYNPHTQKKKKNPVTIIRLYNTILMNPNFDPKSLHALKNIIKFYILQNIPAYDLSVHFFALRSLINRSKNSGVIEALRLGLELLYYNVNHPQQGNIESQIQKKVRDLTKQLQSPIASLDPYEQLFDLMNHEMRRSEESAIFVDYQLPFQDLEVDVIEFIKSDQHTRELANKLVSIRIVNDHPRIIRKIKRHQD